MKAMIFAAGLGTRLGEITADRPKCLVDVGGSPVLAHVIESIKATGITELVINIHHFPEMVREFVMSHGSFGITIHFSQEQDLLETGGGLLRAKEFFSDGDPILVHNADIYCDLSLQDLLSKQTSSSDLGTLLTFTSDHDRVLLFDETHALIGWRNKATGQQELVSVCENPLEFAFGGIYVLSHRIFDFLAEESDKKFSIIQTFLRAAKRGESLRAYVPQEMNWSDIGTPEELESLRSRIA
ncbi:MAG: nucleotidyltransferase family protein [Bdellovibrionales bacterium]|nr:nucleotidyltransferase family protein [Bdellovibrionales bacterium]